MPSSRAIRTIVAACALACGASTLRAQTAQANRPASWLDAPLTNWNTTLTAIPRAKVDKGAEPMDPRCNDTHRSGSSAEDKLVTSAG